MSSELFSTSEASGSSAVAGYRIDADPRFDLFRREIEKASRYGDTIRALAHEIVCTPDPFEDEPAFLWDMRFDQMQRLLNAVQDRIEFVREARFRPPLECWNTRAGDCKSSAILFGAMAHATGAPTRLIAFGVNVPRPTHVVCQVRLSEDDPDWLWAETTIQGAELGEHPVQAMRRLDVEGREDVGGA